MSRFCAAKSIVARYAISYVVYFLMMKYILHSSHVCMTTSSFLIRMSNIESFHSVNYNSYVPEKLFFIRKSKHKKYAKDMLSIKSYSRTCIRISNITRSKEHNNRALLIRTTINNVFLKRNPYKQFDLEANALQHIAITK
uniref:Uncharacterized protein n=1 Tax=Glossina brevipalpis TaxID=37001 RepID=A0A1A9WQU7_9MUSC